MMNTVSRVIVACSLSILFAGAFSTQTSAGIVGTDDSTATAYADGWQSGDNGSTSAGSAFGNWTLSNQGGNSGRFIGDSTSLGFPGADINTGGSSFGMFGHSGEESKAQRDFNGGLLVTQKFSVDIAVNFRNGNKGINLLDSSGNNLFNFNVGSDNYVVTNAASGTGNIVNNSYDANTSFNLMFNQSSAAGGDWMITRNGGLGGITSGTFSGLASGFEAYINNTGSSAENNFYINNLSVTNVPEPSTFLTFGSCFMLLSWRRRRNAK